MTGESRIGNGAGGGDAVISGGRALWLLGDLAVGYDGAGTLTMDSGAEVLSEEAFVGFNSGSNGLVIVQGKDSNNKASSWKITSELTIGKAGSGEVQLTGGSALDIGTETTGTPVRLGVAAGVPERFRSGSIVS